LNIILTAEEVNSAILCLGLDGSQFSRLDDEDKENFCSELSWATTATHTSNPSTCYRPFALISYSYRDNQVHKSAMELMAKEFCFSEVSPHRSPWSCFGDKHGERNFSDESAPSVKIFRVQLPCSRHESMHISG